MKDAKPRITFIWVLLGLVLISPAAAQMPEKFDTTEDAGFYYTIQKGDTLWDLSQKFYDSQWDWPGLWEMNKEIKNPHWIYPGNKIKIYLKSDRNRQFRSVETPEPTVSSPEPQSPPRITPKFNYPTLNRTGFIRKKEAAPLGTIIREKDGNVMMSTNDIVYIKPVGPDAFTPGERYQIFTTEKIKERINKKTYRGIKHLIKADLDILEVKEKYVVGKIGNSYRDATVGDRIMTYYARDTELEVQEAPPAIDAVILGSEDNALMVNDYSIAFINKGTNDHIVPGQIYSVMQTQDHRSVFDGADAVVLDPLYSGKLIVLHTEDISSTVMILSSKRDIHPGDMVK